MKSRTYVMEARADRVDDTRRRILDGARRLFTEQWYDDVTLKSLAQAAGVSHQTVLNHFGSKEGVFAELSRTIEDEREAAATGAPPGDTATAVRLLLERYEDMGLGNARLVVQEHRVPALHDALEHARTSHRAWVERVFAHRLAASGPSRRRKIAALLAATEVMAWKSIRHDYGFSKADTFRALSALVQAAEEMP